MFFIQLPYFPELMFYSGDNKMLENAFRGKRMGAKSGAFTDEDLEAFKYNFSKPCKKINDISSVTGHSHGVLRPPPCP